MGVTGLVFRNVVRRRWPSLLLVALLSALSSGFVLTAATGARRTDSAWRRLLGKTDAPQLLGFTSIDDVDAFVAGLRSRPEVAAVGAFSYMPASPNGMEPNSIGMWGGLGEGFGTTVLRPVIEKGRRADPTRADEVTVNEALAKVANLRVGQKTRFLGPPGLPIDQDATVVGIHKSPLEVGPNSGAPQAMATTAFMARWWPVLRQVPASDALRPSVAIRLVPGTDDRAFLRAVSAQYPNDGFLGSDGLTGDIVSGLNAERTAFWVLAASAALATLALLGLLAARVIRNDGIDGEVLAACGVTRAQRSFTAWAPVAAATAIGLVAATFIAVLASSSVNVGVARLADPATGRWTEPAFLVPIALALGAVLLLATALSAWSLAGSTRRDRVTPLRAARMARLARSSPSALVGTVAVAGAGSPAIRRMTRSTVAIAGLAGGGVVGVLLWTASLGHLDHSYRLQGWDFDAYAEQTIPDPAATAAVDQKLRLLPDIRRLARYDRTQIPIGGSDVDVFGLTQERGTVHPTIRSGRAPAGPDEIAVGPALMARLHTAIGRRIEIEADAGPVVLTVVGEAVFPLIGNGGWGDTASMTSETLSKFVSAPVASGFLFDLVPEADVKAIERSVGDQFQVIRPFSPPAVKHLIDVKGIVSALAAFFALLGSVVFGYGFVASTRRQSRDYAILRTLGFRRPQVLAVATWQVAITVAASIAVAAVSGIVVGRLVWHTTSRGLRVLDAFAVPTQKLGLVLLAVMVIAAVVGLAAAWRPASATVARGLRTE